MGNHSEAVLDVVLKELGRMLQHMHIMEAEDKVSRLGRETNFLRYTFKTFMHMVSVTQCKRKPKTNEWDRNPTYGIFNR